MTTIDRRFKELILAYDMDDRFTIIMNLEKIFRLYYDTEDSDDMCYCGLLDLLPLIELSDKELRESKVWNSFEDGTDSPLLRKVVENGLDMFKVDCDW
jgi:hypothetical protein